MSEVSSLKEVLVASVPGVLVPDPAAGKANRGHLSRVGCCRQQRCGRHAREAGRTPPASRALAATPWVMGYTAESSHAALFGLPERSVWVLRISGQRAGAGRKLPPSWGRGEDGEPGRRQTPPQPGLRSTGHLHAAHAVTEAVSPEAGHVVLLDFHLVALEVSRLVQGDLVVLSLLGTTEGRR